MTDSHESYAPIADLRCPSCSVVVLRKERFNPDRPFGGLPDFCPRCGESLASLMSFPTPIYVADARCPSCKVVVLRAEHYDVTRDRGGAPEFCPRCGEPLTRTRTGAHVTG